MKTFIFQATPDSYDMRSDLKPKRSEVWYARQHRTQMAPGDMVLLWMSGNEEIRGIYGWGQITSPAYLDPESRSDDPEFGVNVKVMGHFKKPILAVDLKKHAVLRDLRILRAPTGTNFLVEPVQEAELNKLLESLGEGAPLAGVTK